MTISIIIATFNAAKTLKRCLDSILPQLNEETELILVDGGSKDETNAIVDSYGEKVSIHISEPDKGIYDAWNKGVKLSKGKWIMFVGADDILLPNAIETYLSTIRKYGNINDYDYICAHNEHVDSTGRVLKVLGEEPTWNKMRIYMPMAHVASLHNKRNLFETIGYYNLDYRICADYELLMRKKDKLKYIFIDSHIARMEVGGMSFSVKAIKEAYNIRKQHHSISPIFNMVLFVVNYLAFKRFIIRNKLKGAKI